MFFLRVCIEGVLLGLGLAVLIGPAFFSLLQTSIERGFKSAFRLSLGIIISDLFLVFFSYLGASRLFEIPNVKDIFGTIGGVVLLGIGTYTFRKKVNSLSEISEGEEIQMPSKWTYLAKGFFMNMANPATWLFWFFWVGVVTSQYSSEGEVDHAAILLFFTTALLTVLATDILKAFIAHTIKSYFTTHTIKILNKIVGVILFVFGFYLFARSVYPLCQVIYCACSN